MSEREQLRYQYTLAEVERLEQALRGPESEVGTLAYQTLKTSVQALSYDYDGEQLSGEALSQAQALEQRILALKQWENSQADELKSEREVRPRLITQRRDYLLQAREHQAFYLYRGDSLRIDVQAEHPLSVNLYNADSRALQGSWNAKVVETHFVAPNSAVYILEYLPQQTLYLDYALSYVSQTTGSRQLTKREQVCSRQDFLAEGREEIETIRVFDEVYKLGLRGQLKAALSGNKQAIIPVQVPAGCKDLLYSLHISTNENIPKPTQGEFEERIKTSYSKIKLLGVNVYEREHGSDLIDKLLLNIRPPKEEDAFCNMYVFTKRQEAKRFQDHTVGEAKFNYDVERSRVGTQSCNGRVSVAGMRQLYFGFENARMRYDNYILFDVVGIKSSTKYYRPIYTLDLKK